jgi:hypothetical protein
MEIYNICAPKESLEVKEVQNNTNTNPTSSLFGKEPKTLEECYQQIAVAITFASMFSTKINVTILLDPEVKQVFINSCTFNYEKTGRYSGNVSKQYENEFLQKYYPNDLPESLEKLRKSNEGK